ncbi:MAG: CotY/CotZ family spore coat protein [Bacilli bacterium]|nr:CotY/CotZ family spore coat protein [Bacilli bacterium]
MCNNERSGRGNCITEILKVINVLQDKACPDSCTDSCDRPVLGGGTKSLGYNTRPIQLFTCCGNGVPFSMPVSKNLTEVCSTSTGENPSANCSSVFRVEKLEGNCCTFRVLVPNDEPGPCGAQWTATDSFFTMDTDCCCAVRCLSDAYVDCV